MELTFEKLASALAQKISRHKDKDPLTLGEICAERVLDMLSDADGGILPMRPTQNEPDPRRTQPIREKAEAKAPPLPEGSLITTVDESAYREALEKADPRVRGADRPKQPVRSGRVSSLGGQSGPSGAIDYWTLEELIKALNEQTPKEFLFTPNGCEEGVKVLAVRNVQPIIMSQGPSVVRLEYGNPGVSGDRSTMDANGQLDEVVLGLTASKIFTLDQSDLNLESVMDELETSLKGMYAPRAAQSEPLGRDPGPIEGMFNMNDPKRRTPMGDSYRIDGTPGWRNASTGSVLQSVIETNKRYGN